MVYIRLFHGRTDPNRNMDGWGTDGPVFGPYDFVHTTYLHNVKLGKPNSNCDKLFTYEDMLYYDGVYYGDWSVFARAILEKAGFKTIPFEQANANLPETSKS